MIEDFDQDRLQRRRAFLELRAETHLVVEIDRGWHQNAAATLLRDAAAVAFIMGDTDSGRVLLHRSGDLFFSLGFAGGLQLLYIAGTLDSEGDGAQEMIDSFDKAFIAHSQRWQPAESPHFEIRLNEESFRPSHLLRVYQALAGRRSEDKKWFGLRNAVHRTLDVNASMPVGPARIPMVTLSQYL